MAGKIILVALILYSVSNFSQCTKLSGMLADKRMNMNVLNMFDRFFHLRHKDAFFIRNFQKYLTDDYLTSYYTKKFQMTQTLKKDISMHAIYLENTVWYTTSITELFTVLYTKYLAANHIISFVNCGFYYTYGEINVERATKCKKVATYLYTFMKIAVEKYIPQMEDFLYFIEGGRNDNSRPYRNLFEAITRYFTHITTVIIRENTQPDVPDNKNEFLKKLLFQEMEFEQNARITLKYFFRNIFFGTPKIDYDFLDNKKKEEEIIFNKKKTSNILNETVTYWEIVDKLVKRIEERDPRIPKLNTRKTEGGDSVTEKLIKSNVVNIIRKLEIRDLVVRGIEQSHISQLKIGSEAQVHQFMVEHFYDGYDVIQKLKFVPLQLENLNRASINVFTNDYSQMGELLLEEDFSTDAKDIISAENYHSAIVQSSIDESFKSDAASFLPSSESFRTTNNSLMKSFSRSIYASNESHRSNASVRFSSTHVLDASQLKANRAKAEEIRRKMAIRASSQMADKSSNMNFSRPDDVSYLASHMAYDIHGNNSKANKRRNTSNYSNIIQNLSQSRHYDGNISKENRFTSSQMIAV